MASGPLPRGIRRAATFCMVVSGLVGLASVHEAVTMTELAEVRHNISKTPSPFMDPKVQREMLEAEVDALEPMRGSRALILGTLAVACSLCFVSGLRMLKPNGLPRTGVRRLLAAAALAAGVLRTLDGAQLAVVFGKVGRTAAAATMFAGNLEDPQAALAARGAAPTVLTVFAIALTVPITAAFVLLSQYFRTERVKKIVAFGDSQAD